MMEMNDDECNIEEQPFTNLGNKRISPDQKNK